jgi:cell division protein FtsX
VSYTNPTVHRTTKILDWAKTAGIALMVLPFVAVLLFAAFTMPGAQ